MNDDIYFDDEEEMMSEEEQDIKDQEDFEEYCREIEKLNPGCTGGC